MNRTKNLLPASFKGISFLVRNEVLSEGGRRIILHDYPNSSERFVEDQGELPPKFSVTAFVTGANFKDNSEKLERALNEKGKGVLSMPTFGSKRVFALPYRKDASQKDVGEIRFELEFVQGRSVSGPSAASKTTQTVYSQGDTARKSISDVLKRIWSIPSETPNVISSQFDLRQFSDAIGKITTVVSNSGDINSTINRIKVNSPSIIRNAVDLADYFIGDSSQKENTGLWQLVSRGLSAGRGIATLIELTRFGSQLSLSLSDIKRAYVSESSDTSDTDVPLWDETTSGRIIRNDNRLNLINAGRVSALVTAYEQIAAASYNTDQEIEETRFLIEDEHQRVMRDDTDDRDIIQSDSEVRKAVEAVRISALEILDQKEQATYSLTTINNVIPVSSFLEAYVLYGETFKTTTELNNRGFEIRDLNPTLAADKLIGNVTVLQS